MQSDTSIVIWHRVLQSLDIVMQYYCDTEIKDASIEIGVRWNKLLDMPFYLHDDFIVMAYNLLFEYLELIGDEFGSNGLLFGNPAGETVIHDLLVNCLEFPGRGVLDSLQIWYWQNYIDGLHSMIAYYAKHGSRGGKEYLRSYHFLKRKLQEDAFLAPSDDYINFTIEHLNQSLGAITKFLQDRAPNNGIIPLHVTKSDSDVSPHRRREEHKTTKHESDDVDSGEGIDGE